MKILHGAWSCSLKQITKGLQIDIGFKHDVLVHFESIAQTFENPKYVKPPNEGIANCAPRA